jgi:hypothetical protein
MVEQLVLIGSGEPDFRLDEHTRAIGRQGVAEARRILTELAAKAAEQAPQRSAA